MEPSSNQKTSSNKWIILFNVCYSLLFIILLYLTLSSNNRIEDMLNNQAIDIMNIRWEAYKYRNKRSYTDKKIEDSDKRKYFETTNLIDKHNYNYENNQTFYKMKYFDDVHFGDQGKSFWNDLFRYFFDQSYYTYVSTKHDWELPATVDWRRLSAVTEVKEQGACGSCWAFSALGALETQYFFKTGKLVSLSTQQLIDCGYKTDNGGCHGGSFYTGFKYIENYGVVADSNYPYYGIQSMCPNLSHKRSIKIDGHVYLQKGSEQELKEAVATIGPIAVAVSAYTHTFLYYYGGVSEGTSCTLDTLDHGVLVVGYGTDPIQGDYWLIKNSWGKYWGENGYIRLRRNGNNRSCIGMLGVYPILR